ncbi:probable DNA primase large subunit [Arachis stenosperma]|uniref:probable DNA primase large subunit n=1 Tax=Arachis stenosperma TaxID=217475 RepID=UPI0025AC59B6|nr:probable DNA primase large subunit [Arachis stenosperma]
MAVTTIDSGTKALEFLALRENDDSTKNTPSISPNDHQIVEALCSSYLGPDFSQPKEYGEISLKDTDQVAKSSFPLCMRRLFEKLREDHHLKHAGRMQLGLFLKGVGLNVDDSLAFWREEFSKKVGLEKFEKDYAYNIRHNYGKEGKKTDYTPYSCQRIIL